jgi:hypothetical protein
MSVHQGFCLAAYLKVSGYLLTETHPRPPSLCSGQALKGGELINIIKLHL